MNTSLYFNNLTDEEILKILDVVSVPYLMTPIQANPDWYGVSSSNIKSLSRGAVSSIYLKYLRSKDETLSLFLSDVVIDIIQLFDLSEAFRGYLLEEKPGDKEELESLIAKKRCPITLDLFMKLLDQSSRERAKIEKEPIIEEPEVEVIDPVEEEPLETIEESQTVKDLELKIMNLEMEIEGLREENRELLFLTEDETEIDQLKAEVSTLKDDRDRLNRDVLELTRQNTAYQTELSSFGEYKKKHNDALLELRDYKIKYISLQADMDQLRYTMKNDAKKLAELQKRNRSLYDQQEDWMMAMHDLTWYKKKWKIPGNTPIHKIWVHLNEQEAKLLSHLLKNYDRLLKSERRQQLDNLKEILIMKEAILILLRQGPLLTQNQ